MASIKSHQRPWVISTWEEYSRSIIDIVTSRQKTKEIYVATYSFYIRDFCASSEKTYLDPSPETVMLSVISGLGIPVNLMIGVPITDEIKVRIKDLISEFPNIKVKSIDEFHAKAWYFERSHPIAIVGSRNFSVSSWTNFDIEVSGSCAKFIGKKLKSLWNGPGCYVK